MNTSKVIPTSDPRPFISLSDRSEVMQFSNGASLSSVRFRRSADGKGWALLGVPASYVNHFSSRLFLLNCKLLAPVWFSKSGFYTALCFSAPPEVIAALAKVYPAPADAEPLVFSAKGDRVLAGTAAVKAVGHLRQAQAGAAQLQVEGV